MARKQNRVRSVRNAELQSNLRHFGMGEVVNLDFWTSADIKRTADEQDAIRAESEEREAWLYRSLMLINATMEDLRKDRDRLCLCCDRSVGYSDLHASTIINGWTVENNRKTVTGLVVLACPKCTEKGSDHIQTRVLDTAWEMWPKAVAIRIRQDTNANKSKGTSR